MRSIHKKEFLFVLLFFVFFCTSPKVSADDTCCLGHGGDTSCNVSTKQLYCADGSVSTQCTCTPQATPTPTAMPTAVPITAPACPANTYFNEGNDSCTCNSGFVVSNNQCVTDTAYCQAHYGSNALFDTSSNACTCTSGYTWNSDATACVTMDELCNEKLGKQSYYNSTNNECYCYDGYAIQNGQCVTVPSPAVANAQATSEQIIPDTPVPIPTLAHVSIPTQSPTKVPATKVVPTINPNHKVPGLHGYILVKKKNNGFFADLLGSIWNVIKVAFNL